jgi:hypothetical protein
MNDWSRLAVDPQTMQKLGPKKELPKYKYAPDMAVQGAPIRKRELPKAPSGGAARTTPFVLDKYLS